jgi:hypothetical protein
MYDGEDAGGEDMCFLLEMYLKIQLERNANDAISDRLEFLDEYLASLYRVASVPLPSSFSLDPHISQCPAVHLPGLLLSTRLQRNCLGRFLCGDRTKR